MTVTGSAELLGTRRAALCQAIGKHEGGAEVSFHLAQRLS